MGAFQIVASRHCEERSNPVYNAYTGLLRQQVVSQWRKGCKATIWNAPSRN